ncbi:sigma-70 family RNA polymerase sigma factor [Allokutzneria albata]|uniref:sigma-70 family RNA polymerase sigma factor n=1 Tax=Allokutzneria albata TaxID=211114 RepID=UPI0004C361F0|nr:sigma-70 family RNA polymerase sigma factor [Allokutzneria albata]
MTSTDDALAERFTEHRAHLLGVAYRITGSLTDSEDAVQEAWFRLAAVDTTEIRELRGWLTTVVGRICLDRLKSAAARRERYVGQWLPEPVVRPLGIPEQANPLDVVVQDDGVRMAALVLLHELSPEQRVAFVLHDAFSVPFTEIADMLGCSVAAARQHASRGRKAVAQADAPPRVDLAEQRRVLESFVAAMATGDPAAIAQVLHPDAVLIGDGGGKVRTAAQRMVGADKISRFAIGLMRMYGELAPVESMRFVLINGDLGMLFAGTDGSNGFRPLDRRVTAFVVRDGKIAALYDVVNPDKLTTVEF